jgi:hypothetical protein
MLDVQYTFTTHTLRTQESQRGSSRCVFREAVTESCYRLIGIRHDRMSGTAIIDGRPKDADLFANGAFSGNPDE